MDEIGLAQAMGQGQGGGMWQGKLQEIVAMLMQGATPEELLQIGVPEQLIMQAMEMVAEETEEDLTAEDLKGALDTYVVRKAQAFAEYQTKKQSIENCTTVEEIEAILV